MEGPDLTSSLIGVLTRFRQESIAFMSDIEGTFCQVRVPAEDTDIEVFVVASRRSQSAAERIPDGHALIRRNLITQLCEFCTMKVC